MVDTPNIRLPSRFFKVDWAVVRRFTPTALTAIRFLSPVYLVPPLLAGGLFLFMILASLAALTDWLDGYLARKWGVVTDRGAELDIYADKVLCGLLLGVGLASPDNWSHIVPTFVLCLYHGTVIVKRVAGETFFTSTRIAKIKMFFEMPSLIMVSTYMDAIGLEWVNELGMWFLFVTTGLACWSMLRYLYPEQIPDWPERLWPRKA